MSRNIEYAKLIAEGHVQRVRARRANEILEENKTYEVGDTVSIEDISSSHYISGFVHQWDAEIIKIRLSKWHSSKKNKAPLLSVERNSTSRAKTILIEKHF